MGFLDNLGNTLSAVGKDAAQKAKDMGESAKTYAQINEIKSKINSCYLQIGQIYFEKCKEDENPELKPLVKMLQEQIDLMNLLNKRLTELKGENSCPVCGNYIPAGAEFCPNCGKRVLQSDNNSVERKKYCPGCGAEVSSESEFCVNCGKKIV